MLRPIPRGTGALNLLTHMVGPLIEDALIDAPNMRPLVAAHLCDLASVSLGATREALAVPRDAGSERRGFAPSRPTSRHTLPGLTFALLQLRGAMESLIATSAGFESEGTSFSEFVLGRRLVRARRLLTDSRWAGRSISSIAFNSGFGDLSYFNRTFKRLYGSAPSDIRAVVDREDA